MAATESFIPDRPAPWTCKSETYWLFFNRSGPLPNDAYDPLEAAHPAFADPAQVGAYKGGLGTVQFVRYSDTPAGPYDELLISPGAFEVPKSIPGGKTNRKTSRVTRIYVSQKETLYNGRKIWNIPKHLARFEVSHTSTQNGSGSATSSPTQGVTVSVYPVDPLVTKPFFRATFTPMKWIPSFALSTNALKGLPGPDLTLVQPPLPQGKDEAEIGTDEWASIFADISTAWGDARLVWAKEGECVEREGFFPGDLGYWSIGLHLKNATLKFGVPETWKA